MNTTARLGMKVIDTPAVDTVNNLRDSINTNAAIADAQFLESTFALRPAAAQKGRVHRATDTGEISIDNGTGLGWTSLGIPDGTAISRSILDTGLVGHSRAGRTLAASDFTDMGDANLVALYGCNGLTDGSGNALALTNKGTVPFGIGVEGAAASAAVFAGSSAQALYRADTGGADPTRIQYGSFGAWFKTAKRGVTQAIVGKMAGAGSRSYLLQIEATNAVLGYVYADGTNSLSASGLIDVCDDRWHFAVAVYDGGSISTYVDGVLRSSTLTPGATIFSAAGPLNIGGQQADGATAAVAPSYGRVDEAFVTASALSADQVRHLYGISMAHGVPSPRKATLRVTRNRRGAALANGDFPSNPAAAYNLVAGSLADLNGGTAFAASGAVGQAPGPDGVPKSALSLQSGNYLQRTDAGLPAALTARSYGIWINCLTHPTSYQNFLSWGTNAGAKLAAFIEPVTGNLSFSNNGDSIVSAARVADGSWHHVVVVEDNTAADGVKRKLYMDGKLVAGSTVMATVTLAGANAFRIGADLGGAQPFTGLVARPWVYAGALTWEQVQKVYMKSAAMLLPSPKDAANHVEALGASNVVLVGDDLEPHWTIDLEVTR